MNRWWSACLLAGMLVSGGCILGGLHPGDDGGVEAADGGRPQDEVDGGGSDGGAQGGGDPLDGGPHEDGGAPDGGSHEDGGALDGGPHEDGGAPDGGPHEDGGAPDGGSHEDGGAPDGGPHEDGGAPDGGAQDGGVEDGGAVTDGGDADGGLCGACASWQICDGSCVLDPSSRWNLVAKSGTVRSTGPDGQAWDVLGGAPDPYVCVTLSGLAASCSLVAMDTFAPVWNQTLASSVPASTLLAGFAFVYNDKDIQFDDLICSGTIPVSADDFQAGALEVSCAQGLGTVLFELKPAGP
jgi:hypothetical protein